MIKRMLFYVADSLIVTSVLTAFLVLVTGNVGRAGFLLSLIVGLVSVAVFDVAAFILECYGASFPEEAS